MFTGLEAGEPFKSKRIARQVDTDAVLRELTALECQGGTAFKTRRFSISPLVVMRNRASRDPGPLRRLTSKHSQGNQRRSLLVSMRPLPLLEGGNMFESEQPATKSSLATLAVVVVIVLVILLVATWLFTRA